MSPSGWDYAEALKDVVLKRREKTLKERGQNAQDRKLVVRVPFTTVVSDL